MLFDVSHLALLVSLMENIDLLVILLFLEILCNLPFFIAAIYVLVMGQKQVVLRKLTSYFL